MLYHKHIVKSSGEKEELQSKTEAREALRKDRKRIQVGSDEKCPTAPALSMASPDAGFHGV